MMLLVKDISFHFLISKEGIPYLGRQQACKKDIRYKYRSMDRWS